MFNPKETVFFLNAEVGKILDLKEDKTDYESLIFPNSLLFPSYLKIRQSLLLGNSGSQFKGTVQTLRGCLRQPSYFESVRRLSNQWA